MGCIVSELAKQFFTIFNGLDKAYGTYRVSQQKANGKHVGEAATIQNPVTEQLWDGHLSGKQGIGIIPINDNSCCNFGAIDIDVYTGLNLQLIKSQVKEKDYPLIVCRSKSGGCHLYLFTKSEVSAELIQTKLKEMAASLGYGNCEIYPRQTKILVERGDIGQWINMPYFNGVKGLRYAIDDNGAAINAEDFLKLVKETSITEKQLTAIQINVKPDLEDGPPCLQYLVTQGFPEGTRNDSLFNLGVYLLKAYPDYWKEKLEDYNLKYMVPPLKSVEVQGVFKSLEKKDYFYTCDKSPLIAYCNKALCITRTYGIGTTSMPTLSCLTKYNSNPPIWFLNVEGHGRIELDTPDLQNPIRFQGRCIESLNMMPPIMKRDQWQNLVQNLLDGVTIIDAPVDASPVGQLLEHLEKFCTSRVQAQNKDELLLGKPLLENNKHIFRMSDFMAYLERQHFREFKVNKITSIFKDKLKAGHQFILVKGKGINCWEVPEFSKQTEGHTVPKFDNTQPY